MGPKHERVLTLVAYGRVRAPNVDIGVVDRLAGLVVDHLDSQGQGDARLVVGDVLADLLSFDVFILQSATVLNTTRNSPHPPNLAGSDLHNGPWSTAGIRMQAPASEKSVPRSISAVTVLLLLWLILDTER